MHRVCHCFTNRVRACIGTNTSKCVSVSVTSENESVSMGSTRTPLDANRITSCTMEVIPMTLSMKEPFSVHGLLQQHLVFSMHSIFSQCPFSRHADRFNNVAFFIFLKPGNHSYKQSHLLGICTVSLSTLTWNGRKLNKFWNSMKKSNLKLGPMPFID